MMYPQSSGYRSILVPTWLWVHDVPTIEWVHICTHSTVSIFLYSLLSECESLLTRLWVHDVPTVEWVQIYTHSTVGTRCTHCRVRTHLHSLDCGYMMYPQSSGYRCIQVPKSPLEPIWAQGGGAQTALSSPYELRQGGTSSPQGPFSRIQGRVCALI